MLLDKPLLFFCKLGLQTTCFAFESLAQERDVFLRAELSLLGVLDPAFETLFTLQKLLAVDRQCFEFLLQPELLALDGNEPFFGLATLVLLFASLVTCIENLSLLEIRSVTQIKDVFVLLVDDFA